MRVAILFLFSYLVSQTDVTGQVTYLKLNDQHEILSSYSFIGNFGDEVYALMEGQPPRSLPFFFWDSMPVREEILVTIYLSQDMPVSTEILDQTFFYMNILCGYHYHPYFYSYKLKQKNTPTNLSEPHCSTHMPISDNGIELYIVDDGNALLGDSRLALAYPESNIIVSQEHILSHSVVLLHEIYHLHAEGFCDNAETWCEDQGDNILNGSVNFCNIYFDSGQLHKMIDSNYPYDFEVPQNISFPVSTECICESSFFSTPSSTTGKSKKPLVPSTEVEFIDELEEIESELDLDLKDNGPLKDFVAKFFRNEDGLNYIRKYYESTLRMDQLDKLLGGKKSAASFKKQHVEAQTQMVRSRVVKLLRKSILESKEINITKEELYRIKSLDKLFDLYFR